MRYALVEGGVVTGGPVVGPESWERPGAVPIPDGLAVVPGWTYDGSTFSPPARVLADVQARALAAVDAERKVRLERGAELVPGVWARLDVEARVDWLGGLAFASTWTYPKAKLFRSPSGAPTAHSFADAAALQAAGAALAQAYDAIQDDAAAAAVAILAAETAEAVDAAVASYLDGGGSP